MWQPLPPIMSNLPPEPVSAICRGCLLLKNRHSQMLMLKCEQENAHGVGLQTGSRNQAEMQDAHSCNMQKISTDLDICFSCCNGCFAVGQCFGAFSYCRKPFPVVAAGVFRFLQNHLQIFSKTRQATQLTFMHSIG